MKQIASEDIASLFRVICNICLEKEHVMKYMVIYIIEGNTSGNIWLFILTKGTRHEMYGYFYWKKEHFRKYMVIYTGKVNIS